MTTDTIQSRHAAQGFRFFAQGQLRKALDAFLAGLRENRADAHCMLGLGRIALASGDFANAREVFTVLAALVPDSYEVRSHLAFIDLREGKPGALEKLRAIAERPTAGLLELLNFANAARESGDVASAASALLRASTLRPDDAVVLSQLGSLSLSRGEGKIALNYLSRACELEPREWSLRVLLARAWWATGAKTEAVRELNIAVEQHPDVPALAEELFTMAMGVANFPLAERAAVRLRAEKDDAGARYRHGLAVMASGRIADAKPLFESALQAAPEAVEPRQALASVVAALGEPARAEKLLEEALARAPAHTSVSNDLALLLLARDEAAKAESVLRKAWRAEAPDEGLALNLALATAKQNKTGEARKFTAVARRSVRSDVRDQAERLERSLA